METSRDDGPTPQPERHEPQLEDVRLRDLSFADWRAILVRAGKEFMSDNAMMLASALAYSAFFAIPSVLLVVVGVFTLAAGPGTITSLMQHFSHVMPAQAASLLDSSLRQLDRHPTQGVVITAVGAVLALWSTTGAMTSYMTAINIAYERKDARNFVRKRIVALTMVAVIGVAFLVVAVLLMFGPPVERLVASHAGPVSGAVGWIWWIAQWPILVVGLLAAFATLLYLGPDVQVRRWQFLTPGSLVAALLWIAASGGFAFYSATFGSYNKTWGSLSAVIVMLTWLWLSAMALLLGAEINAEVERSRALRQLPRLREEQPARPPRRSVEPRPRARRSAPRSG
ncbi:MAG TPA: YihY/virulence factor BrkB family protein [Gaiellaceae bacterium]|jgi:membrane protein|nr:YihY/virulence factor BrkB family protein [Gaiellaceae bacterium]